MRRDRAALPGTASSVQGSSRAACAGGRHCCWAAAAPSHARPPGRCERNLPEASLTSTGRLAACGDTSSDTFPSGLTCRRTDGSACWAPPLGSGLPRVPRHVCLAKASAEAAPCPAAIPTPCCGCPRVARCRPGWRLLLACCTPLARCAPARCGLPCRPTAGMPTPAEPLCPAPAFALHILACS